MAHAAQISAPSAKALGLISFVKTLFRKEHVPHWTEYLRDSHRA